ncbi:hypothetical protein Droror1_Dr00009099 [Drosera rotundifolia]
MQLPLSSSLEMPLSLDAAAISHPGHPCFMVTLQSYNARFMHVPREFVIQAELLMKKFTVVKESKGRMWRVRLSRYYHGSTRHVSFSAGWPDLFKANDSP